MSLPKKILTEYLPLYGFAIDDSDATLAKHKQSSRYLCAKCEYWVVQAWRRGNGWLCNTCDRGGKKTTIPEPASKVYWCCDNDSCQRRLALKRLFEEYTLEFKENCHDGVGGSYYKVSIPRTWNKKVQFLTDLFAIAKPRLGYLVLIHP